MLLVRGVVPTKLLMGLFWLTRIDCKKVCLKCIILKEFRSADIIVLVDCEKKLVFSSALLSCDWKSFK